MKYSIPRIVLAAPQSSSGKTTVVIGALRALTESGYKVQPFKIGPDYIDPSYHSIAAKRTGHNLDTWLVPKKKINDLFINTAKDADIAVIEGVMGLYDGGKNDISSTAQLAKLLQAPVVLVIDCRAMGASAAALALGFKEYDLAVNFAGVILNRLGSATHEAMIREAMEKLNIEVLGAIRRDENMKMPERHLGLMPAYEKDTNDKITYIGQQIAAQIDCEKLVAVAKASPVLSTTQQSTLENAMPAIVDIAIARDEAFSFYYTAGINELKKLGARIKYFSPLHDDALPICDAVIFGGGFPELFAKELSSNKTMLASLRHVVANKMPIYAECGGYMYLMRELVDFDGNIWPMAGIIPTRAIMKKRLQTVGYVSAKTLTDNILLPVGASLHGHEFHFSVQEESVDESFPWAFLFTRNRNNKQYKSGYSKGNILGSYLHMHFLGSPEAAKHLLANAAVFKTNKNKNHEKEDRK